MSEKFVGMVAVKGVIRHQGKVLLVQNAYDHMWQLPGGRMHGDEKPEEAIIREVSEELGIEVRPVSIVAADTFHNEKFGACLVLIYMCELVGGPDTISPKDKEVERFRFIGLDDLDELSVWPAYVGPIRKALAP